MTEQQQQSAKMWEVDLGEAGRKLTTDELATLEAMHQCQMLGRAVVALETMVRVLSSLEGRFDRLEQYLLRIDPHRYPESAGPMLSAASDGRSEAVRMT
jgi:hypothetical protein